MEPHRTTASGGKSRLRLGALAGALLMAAATGVPAAAAAAPSKLTTRADFNTPGGGQIVEHLEKPTASSIPTGGHA